MKDKIDAICFFISQLSIDVLHAFRQQAQQNKASSWLLS